MWATVGTGFTTKEELGRVIRHNLRVQVWLSLCLEGIRDGSGDL